MRLKLDPDDIHTFSTIQHPMLGTHRTLVVKINGKAFNVWRSIDGLEFYSGEGYMQEVDRMLVASMERMLTKVFVDACAAVPEGTELLP